MLLSVVACAVRPHPGPAPLVEARGPIPMVEVSGDRVVLALRAGSAADPPGREGLAAWVAVAIARAAGAEVGVGPELVAFRAAADRVDALVDALGAPLADAELAAARAELASRSRSCWEVAQDAWDAWIYAGHPYGHPIGGRASTLASLTPSEAQSFVSNRYVRGSARVGTPGGAAPGALLALAPRIALPTTPATLPPLVGRRMLVVEAAVGTACAAVGHRAPSRLDPAARAALAIAQALGEGPVFEPRLQDRVLVGSSLPTPVDPSWAARAAEQFALLATEGLDAPAVERGRLAALDAYGPDVEAVDVLAAGLLDGGGSIRSALEVATPTTVNAALSRALDPGAVRMVVVTSDAGTFRLEQTASADVQAVVTATELFR